MSAQPCPNLFPIPRGETAFGPGRDARPAGGPHAGRLGRGLAFALLLAAVLIGAICLPQALHGPDWVEGAAAPGGGAP